MQHCLCLGYIFREKTVKQCSLCPETFRSSHALSKHSRFHSEYMESGRPSYDTKIAEDELSTEDLSVLHKDVLAVYCADSSVPPSSSQDLLEVRRMLKAKFTSITSVDI